MHETRENPLLRRDKNLRQQMGLVSKKLPTTSPQQKAAVSQPSPTPRSKAKKKAKSAAPASEAPADALAPASSLDARDDVIQVFTEICRETTPSSMINRAISSVKTLLNVEAASCFLHDKSSGLLLAHHGGEGGAHIAIPSGTGMVGSCFASAQSEIIADAQNDPRFNSSVDVATGFVTRNLLCVPVVALHKRSDADESETVLAVLQAINRSDDEVFSASDVALIELLASLLSGALERAVLSEEAEREKRKSEALLGAAMALHSAEAPTTRAVRVMRAVLVGLQCERASMLLVDDVHNELLLVCTDSDAAGLRMPISSGVAGAVVTSGLAVRITDAYNDERFDSRADKETGYVTRDLLAVPVLKHNKHTVGCVIEAINQSTGGFQVAHEELLTAIALQIGDGLLPDLIQHMVEERASDTGMENEELRIIRQVLAAEYEDHKKPSSKGEGDEVVPVISVTSEVSALSIEEAGAPAAAATAPIGHELGRRLDDLTRASTVAPLDESVLFELPRGMKIDQLLEWDLDFLSFTGTELMQIAASIFRHSGTLETFRVRTDTLANFLAEVCGRYRPNPYHNFNHGVHVMQGAYIHACMGTGDQAEPLSQLELFALLTAAIGHDVEHPGVTNAFLTKTAAPLAIQYNDISVLESHHSATTFHILRKPGCGLMNNLDEQQRHKMRELMIAMVLATDMAHHNTMVAELSQHAAGHVAMPPVAVLRTFCHVADLGNVVLREDLAEQWAVAVGAEAVSQTVEEQRLGIALPNAKLDDYTREELAARQLVFIDDWVRPLYHVAALLFPGAKSRLPQIERNRDHCKTILSATPAGAGRERFSITAK